MSIKKVKSLFAMVICLSMLVTIFAACGTSSNSSSTSSSTLSSSSSSTTDPAVATEVVREPYEFTLYCNYAWYDTSRIWGEDKVSKVLKDKFNITMKIAKPEGDEKQKLNILIAANELPDALMVDRDSNYEKMIELDKLIPLDELMTKFTNYKKAVLPSTLNLSKINGKVYGILNWFNTDNKDAAAGNNAFAINKKIYESLGSPPLNNTDDLYSYLKAVKAKGIKVDGKDVVPMQFGDGLNIMYYYYSMFHGTYPIVNTVVPLNGQLKCFLNDPKFEESVLFARKLYSENLINKDIFLEKPEQIIEKLSTGRVAVIFQKDVLTPLVIKGSRKNLMTKDPTNDYIIIPAIPGPGLTLQDMKLNPYNTIGWNVLTISKNAKQPERIFELFDYLVSPEGQTLIEFGPKGELYNELDEKGYPILTKSDSTLSEAERKALGTWAWSIIGNSEYTNLAKYAANDRLPEDKKDWSATQQAKLLKNTAFNDDEFMNMYTDSKTPEGIAFTNWQDYINKLSPKLIMAKDDAASQALIKKAIDDVYKNGMEKVEKFMNEKWQSNLKILNNK